MPETITINDIDFARRVHHQLNMGPIGITVEQIIEQFLTDGRVGQTSGNPLTVDQLVKFYLAGEMRLCRPEDHKSDQWIAADPIRGLLEFYPRIRTEQVRLQKLYGLRRPPTWNLESIPDEWGTSAKVETRYHEEKQESELRQQQDAHRQRMERLREQAQEVREEFGLPQTQEEVDRLLFFTVNRCRRGAELLLLDEYLNQFYQVLTPEQKQRFALLEQEDQQHRAVDWLYREHSREEANRLGYEIMDLGFFQNPALVVIDHIQGAGQAEAFMENHGFSAGEREPAGMWDVMQLRIEGDAVIALCGDDRGFEHDWKYYLCVAWYPERFRHFDTIGTIPGVLI